MKPLSVRVCWTNRKPHPHIAHSNAELFTINNPTRSALLSARTPGYVYGASHMRQSWRDPDGPKKIVAGF